MIKTPNFTEFRGAGARVGSNYIGITRNGAITTYAGFYKKNDLKSFSHCILLLDKIQNLIGIQFGDDKLGAGAYTVNHSSDYKIASISAGNFFKINGLNLIDWYGKYVPEKFESDERKNAYFMDLDKKILIKRKSKNNK